MVRCYLGRLRFLWFHLDINGNNSDIFYQLIILSEIRPLFFFLLYCSVYIFSLLQMKSCDNQNKFVSVKMKHHLTLWHTLLLKRWRDTDCLSIDRKFTSNDNFYFKFTHVTLDCDSTVQKRLQCCGLDNRKWKDQKN